MLKFGRKLVTLMMIKVKNLWIGFIFLSYVIALSILKFNSLLSHLLSVSLNDDDDMKVRSNIEQQFPKDDEILVSKSIPSSIESQCPSNPTEGILLHHFF